MSHPRAPDPSEEAAASPLWAVYVSEAEKYDKSLVESWKSDMEGMLIFAGLFSASLTAFIIESYKTLTADSDDATVQLLAQISQQLAAAANGSTFTIPPPTHFAPPASSLVCNVLWFLSLGLSLSCALIATLLEQWARDFLHRADMRSAPVVRARIYSFLYYGLKDFKMHTVVDIIPLLLHASLAFFFAGLVAFLLPINIVLAVVAAVLLTVIMGVYCLLTLLPLWYLDCPYRTPLSAAVWPVSRHLMALWRQHFATVDNVGTSSTETMVEALIHEATAVSPIRSARDYRSLVWTVKSLSDDTELESFVEAIPDLLWSLHTRRRNAYEDHIHKLMRHPDLQLQSRIELFLFGSTSGLLSTDASTRRQITCLKALWAICSTQTVSHGLDFYTHHLHYPPWPGNVSHYSVSTFALMEWSTFCFARVHLDKLVSSLTNCKTDLQTGRTPNLEPVYLYLELPHLPLVRKVEDYIYNADIESTTQLIQKINDFCVTTPYKIYFNYLENSATMKSSLPYRWQNTLDWIILDPSVPFSAFEPLLERALTAVHIRSAQSDDWKDKIVQRLCSFWCPDQPTDIPSTIISYLNPSSINFSYTKFFDMNRDNFIDNFIYNMWLCFPITLGSTSADGMASLMSAIWLVASERRVYGWALYQRTLVAVEAITESESSNSRASVHAMIRWKLLQCLHYSPEGPVIDGVEVPPLRSSMLPTETAVHVPPEFLDAELPPDHGWASKTFQTVLNNRILEAGIAVIAEFLLVFSPDFIPYETTKTLASICSTIYAPQSAIHESHQTQLANGLQRVVDSEHPEIIAELLGVITEGRMFDAYFEAGLSPTPTVAPIFEFDGLAGDREAWLQDTAARTQITEILTSALVSSPNARRIPAILQGLEVLHPTVQ